MTTLPKNRGGLMVHVHDAHANGMVMMDAGLRRELLEAGSGCFEMSAEPSGSCPWQGPTRPPSCR